MSNTIELNREGFLQEPMTQNIGLAQGQKLLPQQFSLLNADLDCMLTNCVAEPIFQADNLAISTRENNIINTTLEKLKYYCIANSLPVHPGQTKEIKFYRGRRIKNSDYCEYDGNKIEFVNTINHLGVILQSDLKPLSHLTHLRTKAIKATNILDTIVDLTKINLTTATTSFNSIIVPSASYGHHIFDEINYDKWEHHKKKGK